MRRLLYALWAVVEAMMPLWYLLAYLTMPLWLPLLAVWVIAYEILERWRHFPERAA